MPLSRTPIINSLRGTHHTSIQSGDNYTLVPSPFSSVSSNTAVDPTIGAKTISDSSEVSKNVVTTLTGKNKKLQTENNSLDKNFLEKLRTHYYGKRAFRSFFEKASFPLNVEKTAVWFYSGAAYITVNEVLRNGEVMNEADTFVHQGLSSAFEVKSDNKKLEKTYRGVNGPDSFDKISEGESTSDMGYLSTSQHLNISSIQSRSKV